MCVIIIIPKGKEISKEEFDMAWEVNPDGAGFALQTSKGVYYHRGFMNKEEFYSKISKYMGRHDLLLHFRISTSKAVNQMQTHPYDINNITTLKGFTKNPVVAMNGIISGQKEYIINKIIYNDTMSYIVDNNLLFNIIGQQIIDAIEEDTGCRWCAITPDNIFISSDFIERDGIYYSNDIHLRYMEMEYYFNYISNEYHIYDLIHNDIYHRIRRDKNLINRINTFIYNKCNESYCVECTKCLTSCKTIRDIKITLKENE